MPPSNPPEAVRALVHRAQHLFRHAWTLSSFGDGASGRGIVFVAYALLPLKRRLPGLRHRVLLLALRIDGAPRRLAFSDRSELIAFEEVFCDGEYGVELTPPPAVIVDAGANIGATSLWFRSQCPAGELGPQERSRPR